MDHQHLNVIIVGNMCAQNVKPDVNDVHGVDPNGVIIVCVSNARNARDAAGIAIKYFMKKMRRILIGVKSISMQVVVKDVGMMFVRNVWNIGILRLAKNSVNNVWIYLSVMSVERSTH